MEEQYNFKEIETNAQTYWQEKNCFQVVEDINREKFYCLTMFPYPSGHLHMGHVRVYTIGDVIARYQQMLGKNVMQPMGWDAFGLPAENAAIKNRVPPAQWTRDNIEHMRSQMLQMGFGYDLSREITTCDPAYYRWEQWFFLRLYKKGLVYRKNADVNWDPVDQTVLANEQVVNGRGWRSGALVVRREIPQWFLKITEYADELLDDIDKLKYWPQQVKTMQRNWIGRSEGVEITFEVKDEDPLTVFTTRPDTLFGVTYIALALEHPLTKKLAKDDPALSHFIEEHRNIKVAEADVATMEKHGMPLNIYARHPITHEKLPIWVANFVLLEYGSGALMAVPAHDQRDFEFAKKYHLPIKQVVVPENETHWDLNLGAFTGTGELIDSFEFTGMSSEEGGPAIIEKLTSLSMGKKQIHYRLRDWSISRQRYWGAPVPIIYCETCGTVPVPENELPVVLPEDVQFEGVASPLKSIDAFYHTTCPNCRGPAVRETDTFDTFVESSWYYARFACKKQNNAMLDGRVNYWVPVDQYVGGIEHAVLHLLYARFFHKLMRDEGLVNSDEPFVRLLSQGMVLNNGEKMSKSKGNVVDPKNLIERFGADTLRLFIIFTSPPEQSLEWSDSGVEGAHRFLKRLWTYAYENKDLIRNQNRLANADLFGGMDWDLASSSHIAIFRELYEILDQVKYDYERQQYNTVVSGCMKMLNLLTKLNQDQKTTNSHEEQGGQNDARPIIVHQGFSIILRLLAPITPHITHQLWQDLHYKGIILEASWPKGSPIVFKVETTELVVQVNGKLRSRIRIPHGASQQLIEEKIKGDSKVIHALNGKEIKKMIIVPGKLVNVVTGP
jgi:leucyl-tRNA synthetase